MAFQIDPNIPLQAGKVQFDPASILMQAQQNAANLEKHRFEMQKLREDYDLAKEQRKQQKAMQMGIASDLAGIQSGTPAQYAPMQFQQQPQQPKAYTGDLMGGDFQLGGNNDPTNGNYQLGGGEVTQEAVAGREPLPIDFLKSALKQSMLNRDYDNALKFQKAIQESEKTTNEYYGGLTEGVDPKTGQPVLLAMTKTGAVPSGYAPRPKDGKAVPVMENGRPKTVQVPKTNEVKILMSDGTLMSGGSIPTPRVIEEPSPEFSPAAIDLAAERYHTDGTLPPMGMGKGGATARSLIISRAAELWPSVKGSNQRVEQLANKANAASLANLQKQTTMINSYEYMANKNADIALEMSRNVDRTGVPVFNRWLLAGRNALAGDVDVSKFNTAINGLAGEYAKIVSGSMGNTALSDAARHEAQKILNNAATQEQFEANVRFIQREMKNRTAGLEAQKQELLKSMNGGKSQNSENSLTNQKEDHAHYIEQRQKLIDAKDIEGANMLTKMYKNKWGIK
jgi:hypothetical protein